MSTLNKQTAENIIIAAKEAAAAFFNEFNESLDPSATDWDAVAWQEDSRGLLGENRNDQKIYNAAWSLYQEELVKETERLEAESTVK